MPDGNAAQVRAIADQVAEAAILKFTSEHPVIAKELPDAKVPAPLKWAGVIVAGIMSVGSAGMLFWMISSISQMQLTLARMDERQSSNTTNWEAKFRGLDERMGRLEAQKEKRDE
jgi:hypothetical protein